MPKTKQVSGGSMLVSSYRPSRIAHARGRRHSGFAQLRSFTLFSKKLGKTCRLPQRADMPGGEVAQGEAMRSWS